MQNGSTSDALYICNNCLYVYQHLFLHTLNILCNKLKRILCSSYSIFISLISQKHQHAVIVFWRHELSIVVKNCSSCFDNISHVTADVESSTPPPSRVCTFYFQILSNKCVYVLKIWAKCEVFPIYGAQLIKVFV